VERVYIVKVSFLGHSARLWNNLEAPQLSQIILHEQSSHAIFPILPSLSHLLARSGIAQQKLLES
jgi:hypothetical protein